MPATFLPLPDGSCGPVAFATWPGGPAHPVPGFRYDRTTDTAWFRLSPRPASVATELLAAPLGYSEVVLHRDPTGEVLALALTSASATLPVALLVPGVMPFLPTSHDPRSGIFEIGLCPTPPLADSVAVPLCDRGGSLIVSALVEPGGILASLTVVLSPAAHPTHPAGLAHRAARPRSRRPRSPLRRRLRRARRLLRRLLR